MEERAIRGIRWTLLGYASTRLGSLATTFALARLLVPGDFGVVAFATLLVAGFLLFGTLGLGSAIVVRQDLGREHLRTALTLMIAAYLACGGILVALSPLAADVLDDPGADAVLRGLTIPVMFGGLTWFHAALLQRELQFSRQFSCMVGQVVAMAAVAIPLAAIGAGVWSLVAGQVVGAGVYTALLVALAPYRVRPGFDSAAARGWCGAGWGFVLQGGISFVEQNADYAVLGVKAGARQLGLYSMAYRIAEIPSNLVVEPVAQATFPGFARMRNRSEPVTDAFLSALRLTTLFAFPLGLIAAGAAEPLVAAVLGPKWVAVTDLLRILGIWGSMRVVHATTGWFVNAMGFSASIGYAYLGLLVVSLPLLVVAADAAGAEGVAWVMVGNVVAMALIVAAIAQRRIGVDARRQWAAVRPCMLAAVPGGLAALAAAEALDGAPAALAAVLALAAGLAAYLACVTLLDRGVLAEGVRGARAVSARTPSATPDA